MSTRRTVIRVENYTKGNICQVFCLVCQCNTHHEVVASYDIDGMRIGDVEDRLTNWIDYHQIIECRDCRAITFRHLNWSSEAKGVGETGEVERLYPPRSVHNPVASFHLNIPSPLYQIYQESINCFNTGSYILCAAGIRALMEGVCADRGITDSLVQNVAANEKAYNSAESDLKVKITTLLIKGLITEPDIGVILEHLVSASKAIHEFASPSMHELKLALDTIEDVIEAVYDIPLAASES